MNPSGYVKGLRSIEKASVSAGKRIESSLTVALNKLHEVEAAAGRLGAAMGKVKLKLSDKAATKSIQAVEKRAIASAAKIKAAYASAMAGGGSRSGGSSGGGSSRSGGGGGGDDKTEGKAAAVDRAKSIMKAGLAGGLVVGGGLLALSKEANVTREKANRLSINSRGAGQDYVDPAQLTKEFYATSQEVKGITADQAAEAATAYVTITGDLGAARRNIGTFAVAATAAGADLTDVSKTAASISQNFGITDPKEMQEGLAAMIYQGKQGAFEMGDASTLMPRLASAGAGLGGLQGLQGLKTLGGLAQLSRANFGDADSSVTALERVLTNVTVKADKLLAAGVEVYDKKTGKKRDVGKTILDSIQMVGGNSQAAKEKGLIDIYGDGYKSLQGLAKTYTNTYADTKGTDAEKTKAARAALDKQYDQAVNASGTWADVQKDSARAQEDSSAKVTAAMERLKESAANKLLPALLKLEPTIMKGVDAFAKIVDFGAEHPGVAITAAIVGSMGAAAIGEAVKAKLLAMMMGGGGGGGGAAGAVAGGGAMTAGAAIAVTAVAGYVAYTEGKDLHNQWDDKSSSQLKKRFNQVGLFGDEVNSQGASTTGHSRWEDIGARVRKAAMEQPAATPGTPKGSLLPSKMQIDNTVNVKVTNAADLKSPTTPTPGHLPR